MKAIKFTCLLVCALALTFAATGCRKKPVGMTDLPGQRAGGPKDGGLEPARPYPPPEEVKNGVPLPAGFEDIERDYNLDREALAPHMVHFDFDSAVVKSSEKPHVSAVAAYMSGQPNKVALLVEGHCDERGTEEYNRSLGERRALALREMLIMELGLDGSRVTTRTHGEDIPLDSGHNEAAWAKNRRGEFVVLHPK